MEIVVMVSNMIKLPDQIAQKLRGKSLAIEETDEGILLKSVDDPITTARGFLRGKGFTTEKYLEQKQEEITLEDGR